MHSRRAVISGLAFGVGLASVFLVGAQATSNSRPSKPAEIDEVTEVSESPFTTDPYANSKDVSLAEAEAAVLFKLHRPDDTLASDDQILHVWLDQETGDETSVITSRVAIQYTTGVEVRLEVVHIPAPNGGSGGVGGEEAGEQTDDTPASFDDLVKRQAEWFAQTSELPLDDFIATVKGTAALTTPYIEGRQPGSVMFLLPDNVRVTIFANLDKDSLLQMAESVT